MFTIRRAILVAALLLAASAVAGVAQPQLGRSADTQSRTITVSGHGTVTAVPDRASFDFTVDTRAQTASDATSRNGSAADALVRALRNAGVAERDLQTSQLSLSPQTTPDGMTVTGYVASTTVTAETAVANAGAVVDAAVQAGTDGVSGPNLSPSNATALYDDALKNAVANAKDKAAALASASGLTLGAVQSVVEGSQTPAPIPFAAKAAAAGSIAPGTQTIEADVTVTFQAT